MRVEPAPFVFRNEDRRQQTEDRRGTGEDRRIDPERPGAEEEGPAPRVKPLAWIEPTFIAHVLGQGEKGRASAREIKRAYLQPEAKTPLRPEAELKI